MGAVRYGARFAVSSGLQCPQSVMHKCPARSGDRIAVSQHDYVRPGAAGLCAHGDWQRIRVVFGGDHQRDNFKHDCAEQPVAASHDLDYLDLWPWKRERDRQHAEWKFGLSGLHQRWNHQCSDPHHHLTYRVWSGHSCPLVWWWCKPAGRSARSTTQTFPCLSQPAPSKKVPPQREEITPTAARQLCISPYWARI